MNLLEARLSFPFAETLPEAGAAVLVAPGVHWIRFPLPFALDHINLWLIEDHFDGRDGFTLIDCGIASEATRALWQEVMLKVMAGSPIVRIICTHTHPDHLGNAAWLSERFAAPLWMTLGEYAMGRVLQAGLPGTDGPTTVAHFLAHGLSDPEHIDKLRARTNYFKTLVPDVPHTFRRIVADEEVVIGGRPFVVMIGHGHSPEHASLYCAELDLLISGDMLLPRISTNVSVHGLEPEANPLEQFLASIARYAPLPEETLVLPSHGRPFRGIAERIGQLQSHHAERLQEVRALCRAPTSAADVVPVMFRRPLDAHQIFFALGEALAHLHALWYRGEVERSFEGGKYRFTLR